MPKHLITDDKVLINDSINALDNKVSTKIETLEKSLKQEKIITFVLPTIFVGPQSIEIKFPYEGELLDVSASCSNPGATKTELWIEKCEEIFYETTPNWQSILSNKVNIDANKKSTNSSTNDFTVANNIVNKNDYFRVNVANVGEGFRGLVAEIKIAIKQ